MKIFKLILFFFLFLLINCSQIMYNQKPVPTSHHVYELKIVDIDNNPIEGVNIEYSLTDRGSTSYSALFTKKSTYITSKDGILHVSIDVTTDPFTYPTYKYYESLFQYKLMKEGYYSESGEMSSKYGRYSNLFLDDSIKTKKIILFRTIDYFDKMFINSLSDKILKKDLLHFIDLLISENIIKESIPITQAINFISFKNKDYLNFKFMSVNVYNSIQLNNYDIGKRLFNEVIRKSLGIINSYIFSSKQYYGIDITVISHKKNFVDDNSSGEQIIFRFLIPNEIIMQYNNKEISDQQLLNSSFILMNEKLIELKLQ